MPLGTLEADLEPFWQPIMKCDNPDALSCFTAYNGPHDRTELNSGLCNRFVRVTHKSRCGPLPG
jgi:hypothetical protein